MAKKRNRGDRLTTAWMVLALILFFVTIAARVVIPQSWWLSIHILTLGVLSNAILQWSWYFSRSLLRLSSDDPRSTTHHYARQILFNAFLVVLLVGMLLANLVVTIVGAAAIGLVITWHGLALLMATRAKLGSRFAVVIRYYLAASAFLVIGVIYGGFIASAMFQIEAPTWVVENREALTLAHSLTNTLGWLGLTIVGTLVTLWPTMLRTRIAEGAVARSTRVLPLLLLGLVIAIASATFGLMPLVALGVGIFTAGITWGIGAPLLSEALRKAPAGYATWSALAGGAWAISGLLVLTVTLFLSQTPVDFRAYAPTLIVMIGVGGVLQILVGALTYLMPVIIGGGPAAVRVGIAVLEQLGPFRLVLRNAALVLAQLAGVAAPIFWLLTAASFLLDLIMFTMVGIKQAGAKRAAAANSDQFIGVQAPPGTKQLKLGDS